ncbi:coiled-coil domain-containing protein 73-like [Branchiostoma lanceolatum]|uniref:CCDC73 protein n=1 Tax=Branchiostoma lanceolatum TaxID=7740 RepID=A0A8K0A1V8_BRALA|nr:CCDC73 [Branchiostoma lanceolatum]
MMQCGPQDVQKEGLEDGSPAIECNDHDTKASNKAEQGNLNADGSEIQPKAFDNGALRQAECLKFRDNLFEVIEELRIRRVTDAENEERISQLVKEKHQLERTREEEAGATSELEKKHAQEITDLHRQYKEQIQQAEDNKNKSVLDLETSEREIKALKEEVQTLHMCKYSLEQKVKEQERQLKLQACAKDSHLSQMTEMEQKCSSLFMQCRQLTETHDRLEKSVKEAIRINKKLNSVNNHQTCLLKRNNTALEAQKKEIQLLKVQGHCKLNNSDVTSSVDHNSLYLLQQELNIQQDLSKQLQLQLEEIRKEKTEAVSSLQECQGLVDRHVETCSLLKQKLEVVELELQNLKTEHEGLKKSFDKQAQELHNLKDVHKDAFEKWGKEEASLQSRLKTLQEDYENLEKAHNNLEELNTSWAKKNIKMTEEIKSLTNNKMLATKDSQAETASAYTQTEMSSTDSSTQTDLQQEGSVNKTDKPKSSSSGQTLPTITSIAPMELNDCSEPMDTCHSKGHDKEDKKPHKHTNIGNITEALPCMEIDLTDEHVGNNTHSPVWEPNKASSLPQIIETSACEKTNSPEAKECTKQLQGSKLNEEFERIDKVFQEAQEETSSGNDSTTASCPQAGTGHKGSSLNKDHRSSTVMVASSDVKGAEMPSNNSADGVTDNRQEKAPVSQLNSGEATGQYQYKFVSLQEALPAVQLHQEKHGKLQALGAVESSQKKGGSETQQEQTGMNEWEELAKSFQPNS